MFWLANKLAFVSINFFNIVYMDLTYMNFNIKNKKQLNYV